MITLKTLAALLLTPAAVLVAVCSVSPAATTTFTGFAGFTMDFVDITGGTTADDTGYGTVAYDYRMGVNEVSGAMIDAYNASGGGPAITRNTGFSATQPAASVSWNEAARFVNWLNVSTGHALAYNFDSGSILGNDNISLWSVGDAGYDPNNLFRNSNAFYFLPSENEWYRAAYFDPDNGVYWDYATGSDTIPTAVAGGTLAGTAVYDWQSEPADIKNAGGLSPFGTMGQNGNAYELMESGRDTPNDSASEMRTSLGGSWKQRRINESRSLRAGVRDWERPTSSNNLVGFRVASIPEPSAMLFALAGGLSVAMRRRRG